VFNAPWFEPNELHERCVNCWQCTDAGLCTDGGVPVAAC
jgi:hypothetical protein